MPCRIANAAGFLGDWLLAPRRTVESARVDYLTLEYLAELTLSILARQREKNPDAGYAEDFLDVLPGLTDALRQQPQLKIVTNAGGMNPLACAKRTAAICQQHGIERIRIGVVSGDDIREHISTWRSQGELFANLDTNEPLEKLDRDIVSANAYLGGQPIARALADGARIVITGRVADASLTVGPVVHEFGWKWDDWNRLAAASVAGHLIECGAQVTGGYSSEWRKGLLSDVGYPIAEINEDGTCVITKPEGTGGVVDRQTVVSQLVYEIGDPAHYLTPDVDCDFTTVSVRDIGPNRVAVEGATGRPAPKTLKVSLAYRDGYFASGQLLVVGTDCVEKARESARIILDRVQAAGHSLAASHVECLGSGEGVPGVSSPPGDLREVVLRISARDPRRESLERFAREFAPLITSGPAGLAGYAAGRPTVRPVFSYWPTTVPRHFITEQVEVRSAAEWSS